MTRIDDVSRPSGGNGKEPDREALFQYLRGQRETVLAILEGLPQPLLRTAAVPSGWTPLGLVEHLTGAEYFWVEMVTTGAAVAQQEQEEQPQEEEDEEGHDYDPQEAGAFTSDRPVAEVLGGYRAQCARNDALLSTIPLDAPAVNRPGWVAPGEPCDLRWVLLHLIEETARHAGHLDIARELLDGTTGLGPR